MAILEPFKIYLQTMGYSVSTQKTIVLYIKEFIRELNLKKPSDLSNITSENIKDYYTYLSTRPTKRGTTGLSAATLSGHIFGLKILFTYAEKLELTTTNPISILSFPKLHSPAREILTKDQIGQLYEVCQTLQERAILGLFYGCGLRRNEGQKLNIRDVDFRHHLLYVRSGKGKKRRAVPLSKTTNQDLKNYFHQQRPKQVSQQTKEQHKTAFMLNQKGRRMRAASYHVYFKNILKRTDLDPSISLHNLRHSIATHLLESGLKIEQVRDFLGHKFMESTQIYTRVDTTKISL